VRPIVIVLDGPPRPSTAVKPRGDTLDGLLTESQGQNLALNVLYVPCSLDSGSEQVPISARPCTLHPEVNRLPHRHRPRRLEPLSPAPYTLNPKSRTLRSVALVINVRNSKPQPPKANPSLNPQHHMPRRRHGALERPRLPPSSEYATHKIVKARFLAWLQG